MRDQTQAFAPPPGPPPSMQISGQEYSLDIGRNLQPQGWSVLHLQQHPHWIFGRDKTYQHHPEVWPALETLFTASKTFFALRSSEKEKFSQDKRDASEEGFSSIKGEKEFITLRRNDAEHCPEVLKDAVETAWEVVFSAMNEGLKGVEMELGLPASSLTRFADPCLKMDARARATMMRLFRYENDEAKVVAEPHMDLGLLSLVIGDTPGLEVLDHNLEIDGNSPCWNPIEQSFEQGMATLMSGRQLQYLTRDRYTPGGHRVVSYGPNTPLIPNNLDDLAPVSRTRRMLNRMSIGSKPKAPTKERYRYSIVFVLRAHEAVPVDYELLETTDLKFDEKDKEAKTAGELFKRIRKAHYNVNIGHEEREKQKKAVLDGRDGANQPKAEENSAVATG